MPDNPYHHRVDIRTLPTGEPNPYFIRNSLLPRANHSDLGIAWEDDSHRPRALTTPMPGYLHRNPITTMLFPLPPFFRSKYAANNGAQYYEPIYIIEDLFPTIEIAAVLTPCIALVVGLVPRNRSRNLVWGLGALWIATGVRWAKERWWDRKLSHDERIRADFRMRGALTGRMERKLVKLEGWEVYWMAGFGVLGLLREIKALVETIEKCRRGVAGEAERKNASEPIGAVQVAGVRGFVACMESSRAGFGRV
jgi:hypothetical protein